MESSFGTIITIFFINFVVSQAGEKFITTHSEISKLYKQQSSYPIELSSQTATVLRNICIDILNLPNMTAVTELPLLSSPGKRNIFSEKINALYSGASIMQQPKISIFSILLNNFMQVIPCVLEGDELYFIQNEIDQSSKLFVLSTRKEKAGSAALQQIETLGLVETGVDAVDSAILPNKLEKKFTNSINFENNAANSSSRSYYNFCETDNLTKIRICNSTFMHLRKWKKADSISHQVTCARQLEVDALSHSRKLAVDCLECTFVSAGDGVTIFYVTSDQHSSESAFVIEKKPYEKDENVLQNIVTNHVNNLKAYQEYRDYAGII